jgi:hypothetical protein
MDIRFREKEGRITFVPWISYHLSNNDRNLLSPAPRYLEKANLEQSTGQVWFWDTCL